MQVLPDEAQPLEGLARTYTIKDAQLLAERRRQIVTVATRLFGSQGYSNVSVNDIAAAAGISIGSLYKYVESKGDILQLIVDGIHSAFEAKMSQHPPEKVSPSEELRWMVERILLAADQVKNEVKLLYREYPSLSKAAQRSYNERHDRELAAIENIIHKGTALGEFVCPQSRVAALNILGSVEAWCLERWALGDMDLAAYTATQANLFVRMLQSKDFVNGHS
jgi:TetR/AcrR family transcriptional regulator, cholesterol catabolism regulator